MNGSFCSKKGHFSTLSIRNPMKPCQMNELNKEEQEKKKAELERLIHHKTVKALRELDALIEGHLHDNESASNEEESTETKKDYGQ